MTYLINQPLTCLILIYKTLISQYTPTCNPLCRARNVIAAILKRLAHRNPNVQLYSLALTESLSKNCTIDLHREIASRAFTQALEKLITDRVSLRLLCIQYNHFEQELIALWSGFLDHT